MPESIEERSQIVVFLRHAAAAHNFHGADICSSHFFDPSLVFQGKIAALEAGERIFNWWRESHPEKSINLVITSPLTRCIQTAVLAFLSGGKYDDNTEVRCEESVREACGVHYPDKRRNRSLLENHWTMIQFEPSMTEEDELWGKTHRENWIHLQHRVQDFIEGLAYRTEDNIVVVSHGVWIECCLKTFCPEALGNRRVYNCDAFACRYISKGNRFQRLEMVCQI
jgi:broad specificity phosphatase PhoE